MLILYERTLPPPLCQLCGTTIAERDDTFAISDTFDHTSRHNGNLVCEPCGSALQRGGPRELADRMRTVWCDRFPLPKDRDRLSHWFGVATDVEVGRIEVGFPEPLVEREPDTEDLVAEAASIPF